MHLLDGVGQACWGAPHTTRLPAGEATDERLAAMEAAMRQMAASLERLTSDRFEQKLHEQKLPLVALANFDDEDPACLSVAR